jgi:DHA2 family multidrug resistance protein
MSFIDIFVLITVLFAGLAVTALLMKKPAAPAGAAAH